MKMKYIIVEQFGSCFDVPILFPTFIEHSAIVSKMGLTRDKISSAGRTWFNAEGRVVTRAGAISLAFNPKHKERDEQEDLDARLIQKAWEFQE